MIASFDQVTKLYGGGDGLKSTSFQLQEGQVVGLFGLNGSGKTTTLKLLSGLLNPSEGSVTILNQSPREARDDISYLGDKSSFFPWMTTKDVENFMDGMFINFDRKKFQELSKALEVPEKPMGKMSKGQAQRLRLVATMARKARLYLLDEPLSGIDMVSRALIVKTLISSWDQNSCLLLTTHEIKEVEHFFDRGIYLKDGSLVSDVMGEKLRAENSNLADHFIDLHTGASS